MPTTFTIPGTSFVLDYANLRGSVVTSIDAAVVKLVRAKFPSEQVSLPHLEMLIEGAIGTADDLLHEYAIGKILTSIDTHVDAVLTSLAAKYPAAAPEINALKAKLDATLNPPAAVTPPASATSVTVETTVP